jgi:hypothetical protein
MIGATWYGLRILLIIGIAASVFAGAAGQVRAVAPQELTCFAETNQCLQGRFLAYWQANGGLAQFGYPLTGEQPELLEDGKTYTVQYFERARFEYHPENPSPSDILLGQFGRRVLGGDYLGNEAAYQDAVAGVMPNGSGRFFPETGHNVGGRFLAYWEASGGLARFGYPITEERIDTLDDCCTAGRRNYTTQYFERARFEYHPENVGTPYEVLLGQFGRRILADNVLLAGDFRALYLTDESVRLRFGRPLQGTVQSPGVLQPFERGRMYYSTAGGGIYSGERMIYVLCGTAERGVTVAGPNTGFFPDTWVEGQDPGGGPGPTLGLYNPHRGFGKVWREDQRVRDCLGYATTPTEIGFPITIQFFASGALLLNDTPEGRFIYAIDTFARCKDCLREGTYERFTVPIP